MSKYVTQVRYYGDGDSRNSSDNVTATSLVTGSIFSDYAPITQLGIQTSPLFEYKEGETEVSVRPSFYVNDGMNSIQIGRTGIYELDLEGISSIKKLRLAEDFVVAIQKVGEGAYVMIDLVYEG